MTQTTSQKSIDTQAVPAQHPLARRARAYVSGLDRATRMFPPTEANRERLDQHRQLLLDLADALDAATCESERPDMAVAS